MFTVIILLQVTEARVFCEDSNAMPWTASGMSCPVICASVRNAIDRLIMIDYKNTVREKFGTGIVNSWLFDDVYETLNNENNEILRQTVHNKEAVYNNYKTGNNSGKFNTINYINRQSFKGVLRRNNDIENADIKIDGNYVAKHGHKCWYLEKFKPSLLIGKIVYRKCTRKSNFDGKFLSIMTNVLNQYTDTLFQFTEDMTEILLENIFGKNTDLRNNIFDVNKLLKYLQRSVDLHKSHSNIISLKSRHCLTISIPGCYCKPGYVESSGQCVKPSDCVNEEHYKKYLNRIVV